MSEELCPSCKKPMSECTCVRVLHEGLSKKTETETETTTDTNLKEELAKEKKKREEYEAIIGAEAVKQFETEKTAFLSLIDDEEKRQIVSEKIGDDPDRLSEYQRMADFLGQTLAERGVRITVPTGKVGLPPKSSGVQESDQARKLVDSLYDMAMNAPSEKERKEANRKIDELYMELVHGLRVSHGKMELSISQCPECGVLLHGNAESCPSCGWKHQLRLKENRTLG